MAPKLYITHPSAPARAVLITAKAIALRLDLELVNLVENQQQSPEYLKKNPQHTVPTLQESDGFTCWDSHAINAYLVGKYAKDDSLYPKDLRKRVVVDQRLHFDSGVLFTKLSAISKNPQHTVPTLEEEDGFVCWDSHAIMTYLISKYAKDDSLYPKDPKKRVVVDQRLHFDSGVVFARMLAILQPFLYKGVKTLEDQSKIDGIHQAYEFLNSFLEGNKWIAGNAKTIADYSLFTSISSISTIIPVDEKKYPRVVVWLKQVAALPESKENVKGLELFKQLFSGLL